MRDASRLPVVASFLLLPFHHLADAARLRNDRDLAHDIDEF